ncbi:helix-turn-helix domain-containing protein [Pseudonocardia xinjiangensis]|uniref:helix-turn-helix domain-containing protein n=1 Tax=Pseudonocardia xinjiangensis TaxID=75289 RepID=UPI003D8B00B6
MEAERLLSTKQAADALGLAERSLSRWAREGRLTPTIETPGGQFRWDLEDLRTQLRALRRKTD